MAKFTMNMSDPEEALLDDLQGPLGANTRAGVVRKALHLAQIYAEVRSKNQNLLVGAEDGTPLQRIRLI